MPLTDFNFSRLRPDDTVTIAFDRHFNRPQAGRVLRIDASPADGEMGTGGGGEALQVITVAGRVVDVVWFHTDPRIAQRAELFVPNGDHAIFKLSEKTQQEWDTADRIVSMTADLLTLSDEVEALKANVAMLLADGLPEGVTRVASPRKKAAKKKAAKKPDLPVECDESVARVPSEATA